MRKLTPEQIKYYSKRLIHYLRGVRKRKGYSQEDMAQIIDYSLSHYRRLETEGYADEGKFINAIDLLSVLGSLENMNLPEFISYLENTESNKFDELIVDYHKFDSTTEKRPLYPWEKYVLLHFNKLDMDTRLEFVERFMAEKIESIDLTRVLKIALLFDELIIRKMSIFNLNLFDLTLEYILVHVKKKSENRKVVVLNSLKKLFFDL